MCLLLVPVCRRPRARRRHRPTHQLGLRRQAEGRLQLDHRVRGHRWGRSIWLVPRLYLLPHAHTLTLLLTALASFDRAQRDSRRHVHFLDFPVPRSLVAHRSPPEPPPSPCNHRAVSVRTARVQRELVVRRLSAVRLRMLLTSVLSPPG